MLDPDNEFVPDNAFYNMLGAAFAVMITVAAAMVMVLPAVDGPGSDVEAMAWAPSSVSQPPQAPEVRDQ